MSTNTKYIVRHSEQKIMEIAKKYCKLYSISVIIIKVLVRRFVYYEILRGYEHCFFDKIN